MNKPEPARYRTTNWKSDNEALKRSGSLQIWLDKDMVWLAPKAGRTGRPPVFSDAAIQFCLMVKVLFGLPLRQTTGMVSSILQMAGLDWPVPDFSTLSRRQKTITVEVSFRRALAPLNLLVDSSGIKFLGDGEWLARTQGTHRRQYRKVHLAMDAATGDIWAVAFTSSREGDSPVLHQRLDQVPDGEEIGTGTGDGAFDTRRCHAAILARGGTAIIPIRKNGRFWKEDCPAARAPMTSCASPDSSGGRSGGGGPATMSEVASRRRCAVSSHSEKGSPHETATARPPKSTPASFAGSLGPVAFACSVMNRFNALGQPEIERVA